MSLALCYWEDASRLTKGDMAGAMDVMPSFSKLIMIFAILIISLNAFVVYRYGRDNR